MMQDIGKKRSSHLGPHFHQFGWVRWVWYNCSLDLFKLMKRALPCFQKNVNFISFKLRPCIHSEHSIRARTYYLTKQHKISCNTFLVCPPVLLPSSSLCHYASLDEEKFHKYLASTKRSWTTVRMSSWTKIHPQRPLQWGKCGSDCFL